MWFEQNFKERLERLEKQMIPLSQGFSDLQKVTAQLVADDASVKATVLQLQQQVAAGSPVTGDQLEAIVTQLTSVGNDLAAISAPPAAPPVADAAAKKPTT